MTKQKQAEKDYMDGMKYKDIAEKYGTTINTVKSWKKRYAWDRKKGAHKNEKGCTQNKKGAPVTVKIDDGTMETLQNDELTPEQQLFCIYYIKSFNATQSYLKAYGCSYDVANAEGYKLLVKPCIKAEIERLKEIKRQQIVVSEFDIVELQMRIAFADIGEYVFFGAMDVEGEKLNSVKLKDSNRTDTQLIREVKEGKSGISIKLEDRQKAIDWLTKYFLMHPDDKHRQEFDRQKLELELLKLEMKTRAEDESDNPVEDNFLEALNASAKDVWEDE